jgi:hypothetical protein
MTEGRKKNAAFRMGNGEGKILEAEVSQGYKE